VICPSCSYENEPGAKFCNECGTPLAAGCPRCGATNKPGAKFCNECGTPLGGAPAVQTRTATADTGAAGATSTAERRLVTVLFADIVGFTPFAEERDAEDVRDALSRYFELCSQVIGRYGGTIEKFIGDAVMAVWGAPIAHEDDAERAVRAGLELVDAVGTIAPNVQARAGVLTGEAAVTIGATNQGMVAGDMVNTAARLQSVAAAGTVLVGEATFRAASSAIVFEPAEEQVLKGKESPVPAWRAVRVVAELGGRNRRTEGLEAPFVGRADELRLLKDLLHATAREQKARLVSLMGPGGIGKSRLAWELSKYVDGLVEDTYWHSGRSPAYGEGITFWALGEMVRGRCELVESDDEGTTRRKVGETVAAWIQDPEQRRWVETSLLALLGLETDVPSDQLFGAWRTFFESISKKGTVAMVFEDLHHADSGLLDFIDHMLEWSRGHPIYIVTLARPELLEKRPDWGAAKRSFTSIYLEPLAEPEMRELLAGLAPGLPDQAVKAVIDRADGMPLYAVETVRMLVADGRLKEEGGFYVPVGDLTTLAVPETLTALISSRLDGLDAQDRALVHDAAVLGQSFTLEALAGVSGLNTDDLTERLNGLVRRELVTREMDARSAERGQFAFMQSLIREVAYNTLSKKDRKARHLAAARYFEQIGSDELASALASHYFSAYRNAGEGPEADALAAQARIALKGAADRAVVLAAYDQAIRLLDEASEITFDKAELMDIHERAGEAAIRASSIEIAEKHLVAAVELARDSGDRVALARTTVSLGQALTEARRNQEALELLERALFDFGDLGEHPEVLRLKTWLARALLQNEHYPRAISIADEVLPIAERQNLITTVVQMLVVKGNALNTAGRQREGIALIKGGRDLARDHGIDDMLASSLTVLTAALGETDALGAFEAATEGLAIAKRLGRRDRLLIAINNAGYTGFLVGDWDTAVTELDGALATDPDPGQRIWLLSNWLIIHACRGDDVSAGLLELEQLVRSLDELETRDAANDATANAAFASGDMARAGADWREVAVGHVELAPWSHYQAGRTALWVGDESTLRADLAALDASGVHGRIVEVRRSTLAAGLAALEGRPEEAHRHYAEALDGWREARMVWDEALTGIDMATVLDPADPKVRAVAARTREILERLGAKPFIERLDAALSRSPGAASTTRPVVGQARTVETPVA
jgi:class 3 adenylate cyclase/tetratricopeptide (TPR) repeat protein